MSNAVKLYRSTDLNAPVLTGEVGKLIDLLTAVLVNGYTAASVTGITRSGSVATATLASANTTMRNGDYITIAGADQSEYNGEHQITVLSSTQLSFTVSGTPATPATGTIAYKKSPAGWTKPFTGTNKAAFRGGSTNNSAQFYLRVDDSAATAGGALESAVRGYESMTDVDTGSGPFPTVVEYASGFCWRKSATANSTSRDWAIVADDRGFYLQLNHGGTSVTTDIHYFGWFPSQKAGDAFNCIITGNTTFNSSTAANGLMQCIGFGSVTTAVSLARIARSYSQTGGPAVGCSLTTATDASAATIGRPSVLRFDCSYPNGPDAALWQFPVYIIGDSTNYRGRFPGAAEYMHSTLPINNWEFASNISGLPGVTEIGLEGKSGALAGLLLVDITGPWS